MKTFQVSIFLELGPPVLFQFLGLQIEQPQADFVQFEGLYFFQIWNLDKDCRGEE